MGILDTITHQIELHFNFLSDVSLDLINFVSNSISHRSNSLSKDCTLTFNDFNFLAQLLRTFSMLRVLAGMALLSGAALSLYFVGLEHSNCIMEFKYLLTKCQALLCSTIRSSCSLHVARLGRRTASPGSRCGLVRIRGHRARKPTTTLRWYV